MRNTELFIQYLIEVSVPEQVEILIARLSSLGIEAFEEQEKLLIASGPDNVVDCMEIEEILKFFTLTYKKNEIVNQNWNAQWESSFDPVRIDDFAGIRASFHSPLEGVTHDLVITPKMSFGTGHHDTTWLVVKAMETIDFNNQSVLDFGTGTGVLAILADRLGAATVLGIDIDNWSIENAIENIAVNNAAHVKVQQADAIPGSEKFGIILANINKHVLLANGGAMESATIEGGQWILSGLLESDEEEMLQMAATLGMVHVATSRRNGWIAIHFMKHSG